MNIHRSLIYFLLSLISITSFAQAKDEPVYPKNINQLIENWDKDQHLYVKGDIGLKKIDLKKLEMWLDQKGKNWTIILMRNANGEIWKDTNGSIYYSMDAVENAVGRGLSNKTEFLSQLNSKTKTRNGAIFILFLDERKLSYFASDAFDSRGLGESNWVGNLDSKAKNAMRNGGGIVDAVISTVTSIEGKLNASLRREAERAQRMKTERESAKLWVERESKKQLIQIDELEKQVGQFLSHDEVKHNDLANPALNDWREIIANAAKNSDPFVAKNAIKEIENNVKRHRLKLQRWNEDHATIEGLNNLINHFKPNENQSKSDLQAAKAAIAKTHELHTTGQVAYRENLANAKQLYISLEADRVEHERMAAQQERTEAAAAKQKKVALATGGGATGVGLLGLGIYSNRRRRKQKALAEELYKDWKTAMKARIDKLFKTMDRAGTIVGSERDLPERGYEGETLRESISAIRNVDKAFILSSSVHTALEKAKDLIYPANPVGKTVNVFRRARYDDAVDLLERKPLQADPKKEEMKVENRGEETMLGDKTKADKVKMTFTDLIAEFDRTLTSADTSLELVENSWETIASRCEKLGDLLESINTEEVNIEKAAQKDGLYQLDSLFDLWLPRSREHYEKGIKTGKHDPVKALQTDIKRADTMAAEMQSTVKLAKDLRKTELESILKNATELKQLNRNNQWVSNTLAHLNDRFESISKQGSDTTVADNLKSLSDEIFSLRPKVTHASKIANYTANKLPKTIAGVHESVEKTRQSIAKELDLSPENILNEHREWNPDIILTDAELFRIRAQDMIDLGHITQAQEQSNFSDDKTAEASTVVADTLLAHKHYDTTLAEVETLARESEKTAQEGIVIMGELTQAYHSDALLIDPTDADYGNLTEVEEALLGAERQLEQDITKAKKNHTKGFVLTARHNLRNGKSAHEHIAGMHTLISNRLAELRDLEQKNAHSLKSLTNEKEALGKTMDDHRTTRSTQQYFQQLQHHFKHLTLTVEAPNGESNPFKAAKLLAETRDRVKALESQIEADREVFAAAEALADQLAHQYRTAESLIRTAQQDGITDSRQTTQAIRLIQLHSKRIDNQLSSLKIPHTQWQNLYSEIQQTGQALSQAMASLKHELEQAQQALASIRSASSNVSAAMHWSGSYGVRIGGSYGKRAYQGAREALDSGDYHQASSLASSAINSARSAISSAESEVASIRSARAAAERRRRQSRRSSSSGISFGGGGGGSSSGGSFSSGSSSSGSSGSSSSGFSRSGW